jgi:hypothetical protein
MSEVKKITVQVARPRGVFPGRVVFGYYKVENDTVIMTDKDGNPAGLETGKTWSRRLKPGDSAHVIAVNLTKDLRNEFKGGQSVSGFSGPIPYPKGYCGTIY